MNLYVDDGRSVPDDSWTLAKTADEAIEYLKTGQVKTLSLDHDLGHPQKDGKYIVNWLERRVHNGTINKLPVILIHSANPVGRYNMQHAIRSMRQHLQSKS